jgi:hypothetical protein
LSKSLIQKEQQIKYFLNNSVSISITIVNANKLPVEMPSIFRTDPEAYDDKAEELKKVALKNCN